MIRRNIPAIVLCLTIIAIAFLLGWGLSGMGVSS